MVPVQRAAAYIPAEPVRPRNRRHSPRAPEPMPAPAPAPVQAAAPPPRFMSEMEEMDEHRQCPGPATLASPSADQRGNPRWRAIWQGLRAISFADTERLLAPVPAAVRGARRGAALQAAAASATTPATAGNGVRPPAPAEQPVGASLFVEKREDMERDLDVPAFMRRMQF